jgi:transcriptional regulator with XRE-family HTH domain
MFVSHVDCMGQFVPFVKDKVSREFARETRHIRAMPTVPQESEFNSQVQKRVAEMRTANGWTQEEMARFLDVPKDRYKKYENRQGSAFPLYLLPVVARLTNRSLSYLLTGRDDFGVGKVKSRQSEAPSAEALERALADNLPMAVTVPEEKRARFLAEVVAETLGLPASPLTNSASAHSKKSDDLAGGALPPETTT